MYISIYVYIHIYTYILSLSYLYVCILVDRSTIVQVKVLNYIAMYVILRSVVSGMSIQTLSSGPFRVGFSKTNFDVKDKPTNWVTVLSYRGKLFRPFFSFFFFFLSFSLFCLVSTVFFLFLKRFLFRIKMRGLVCLGLY